ncbi:MAG: ArsR family transcriptional regulator [Nanoarchaeota archaeon]
MVNRTIPIIENKVYSEILFAINTKEITSTDLANILKKEQSPIYRQLMYLYKNGYLDLEVKKQQFNKKLFSINWIKVNQEFINFLKIKKSELIYEQSQSAKIKLLKLKRGLLPIKQFDNDYLNRLQKNKYLILFFQNVFKALEDFPNKIKTKINEKNVYNIETNLKGIFNFICNPAITMGSFVHHNTKYYNNEIIDKKLKEDKEFKDFYDLNQLLSLLNVKPLGLTLGVNAYALLLDDIIEKKI